MHQLNNTQWFDVNIRNVKDHVDAIVLNNYGK